MLEIAGGILLAVFFLKTWPVLLEVSVWALVALWHWRWRIVKTCVGAFVGMGVLAGLARLGLYIAYGSPEPYETTSTLLAEEAQSEVELEPDPPARAVLAGSATRRAIEAAYAAPDAGVWRPSPRDLAVLRRSYPSIAREYEEGIKTRSGHLQ